MLQANDYLSQIRANIDHSPELDAWPAAQTELPLLSMQTNYTYYMNKSYTMTLNKQNCVNKNVVLCNTIKLLKYTSLISPERSLLGYT